MLIFPRAALLCLLALNAVVMTILFTAIMTGASAALPVLSKRLRGTAAVGLQGVGQSAGYSAARMCTEP